MKITEDTAEKLSITNDESGFARVLGGLFLICAAFALTMLMTGSYVREEERFWGLLCGAAIFLVSGLAIYERASFEFDKRRKELHWVRVRAFSRRSGVVAFAHIKDVLAQALGNPVNPKRRLVLLLEEGQLPLTTALAPSTEDLHQEIRKRILALVPLQQ